MVKSKLEQMLDEFLMAQLLLPNIYQFPSNYYYNAVINYAKIFLVLRNESHAAGKPSMRAVRQGNVKVKASKPRQWLLLMCKFNICSAKLFCLYGMGVCVYALGHSVFHAVAAAAAVNRPKNLQLINLLTRMASPAGRIWTAFIYEWIVFPREARPNAIEIGINI